MCGWIRINTPKMYGHSVARPPPCSGGVFQRWEACYRITLRARLEKEDRSGIVLPVRALAPLSLVHSPRRPFDALRPADHKPTTTTQWLRESCVANHLLVDPAFTHPSYHRKTKYTPQTAMLRAPSPMSTDFREIRDERIATAPSLSPARRIQTVLSATNRIHCNHSQLELSIWCMPSKSNDHRSAVKGLL